MLNDVEKRVMEVINRQIKDDLPGIEVNADDKIMETGINSIIFIKIIVGLETEFGIEFGDESLDISKFVIIRDLAKYIESQI